MPQDLVVYLILSSVQMLAAIVLTASALYSGLKVLDRMTTGIEEWKEIKKGNVAVGIFYAAAIICFIIFMLPRIEDILSMVSAHYPVKTIALGLVFSFINYIIALGFGTIILYLSINLVDKLTTDIDEMGALKKGNIAVALIFSLMLLSVAIAVSFPLESFFVGLKGIEAAFISAI